MPGDVETSVRNEALTHVNVVDPASGKTAVDEDSAMVASKVKRCDHVDTGSIPQAPYPRFYC